MEGSRVFDLGLAPAPCAWTSAAATRVMGTAVAASEAAAPTVTSADPTVNRQRHVRAAVEALERAFDGFGKHAFVEGVKEWERTLDPKAKKLKALPTKVRQAGGRVPASPPALRLARDEFIRASGMARSLTRVASAAPHKARVTGAMSLSDQVRTACRVCPPVACACSCVGAFA